MTESEFTETPPTTALTGLRSWFRGSQQSPGETPGLTDPQSAAPIVSPMRLALPPSDGKTPIEFATLLLRAGAEIEHSLLVQYLYAAYSINEQQDSRELADLALRWKTSIRLVAREEMAHLITVQNLLLALDRDFHLNRGHLHGDDENKALPFVLEPLSLASLAKYVILESPSDDQIDAETASLMKTVRETIDEQSHLRLTRIGLLYAALYWIFLESDDPGSDWPFPPEWVDEFKCTYPREFHLLGPEFNTRDYQEKEATAQEWGVHEADTHADGGNPRAVALASLRWIMAQGEGPNAIEESHFFRFLKMFEQFRKKGSDAPLLVSNVPINPTANGGPGQPGSTPIVNPDSRNLGRLFNIRYQLLLLDALQSLSSSRTGEPQARRRYAEWSVKEMEFLKRIGQILPHRPLGSRINDDEGKAAAPFQTAWLPPDSPQRTHLQKELIEESGHLLANMRDPQTARTEDPWVATEPSLFDDIAVHDDRMNRAMQLDASIAAQNPIESEA
jgi:hypothetical protein